MLAVADLHHNPPPQPRPNFFLNFMQFLEHFDKIVCCPPSPEGCPGIMDPPRASDHTSQIEKKHDII